MNSLTLQLYKPSLPSPTGIAHAYMLHEEKTVHELLTKVAIQSTTRGNDEPLLESVHRTGLSVLLTKRLTVAALFPTAP